MYRRLIPGIVWLIGVQVIVMGGTSDMALADEIIRPLRDLAEARGKRIGVAVNAGALEHDPVYRRMVGREFNVITPENAMKHGPLCPAPGEYDFTAGDAIVSFAEEHGMRVRGHTLVWHNQLPQWLTEGDYSRDELCGLLREHIQTLVQHYRGKVFAWDVVNEALDENGSLRKTIWLERIGPEYIVWAFRWAREADPDALLFYNDYEHEGGGKRSKA
ncbi:MAG: endo,4-beta-xylanase, partial [Candidatus Hydrogenedentes bacterium]|nr:endo,4-beta-xylanase [Candidatus Hydrogenedentota bacterium]